MPIDYTRYPPDWHAFSRAIRLERAQGRCECQGECGVSHLDARGLARCSVANHTPAPWRPRTRIVLTVAHLCACDPLCAQPRHVRALCQKCHLALDQALHARHAAETRRRRKEAQGQLSFLEETR